MQFEEKLLKAWLEMSACIRGNRVLKGLTFNEIMVCNFLSQSEMPMTATELCEKTHLLKSQINKLLTGMEKKHLIIRQRSAADKRKVHILINQDYFDDYLNEHERVIQILSQMKKEMGDDNIELLTNLMHEAVVIFQKQTVQGD